jgi:hypothetical protein
MKKELSRPRNFQGSSVLISLDTKSSLIRNGKLDTKASRDPFSHAGKTIQHATFDCDCPQNVHAAHGTGGRRARRDVLRPIRCGNGSWPFARGSCVVRHHFALPSPPPLALRQRSPQDSPGRRIAQTTVPRLAV